MSQRMVTFPKRRYTLATYISFLLISIAIILLLATIGSIEMLLRPALITQVSGAMERDAQTRIQLIDTYLSERFNDTKTLSESTPIKSLLNGDQASAAAVTDIFFTSFHRDVADYISISLLDMQNQVVLSYPTNPQMHGKYLIQPEVVQQLKSSLKVAISDVFYDPVANNPSVDLYASVVNAAFQPIGTIRASLSLHRLWQPVDGEPQANGTDSYAFVLDQHGVRIAYTNPDHSGFTHPKYLFEAIAPLTPAFQQQIKDEGLYGNNTTSVASFNDTTLVDQQSNLQSPAIFQFDPAEQHATFVAARYSSAVVPWTYFLLKPLSSVTGLADQQLLTVILIVFFVLSLAVIIGIQIGRRMTMPIMTSVASLRKSSLALKTLASEEREIATEQSWMVEASQMALKSIKYYTDAMNLAAQRLTAIYSELKQGSRFYDAEQMNRALNEALEAARYIELAVKHQDRMNEKLISAVRVTTQAATQLTNGAKSSDDAAAQLEYIVRQLMTVVGDRGSRTTRLPDR